MNSRRTYFQIIWRLTVLLAVVGGLLGLQFTAMVQAAEGDLLWVKSMSGTGNEYGSDVLISKLEASDISLAVMLDVVLVIDASDSMTYDAPVDRNDPEHYLRDPSQCNPLHDCHPFEDAKDAAIAFVDRLNFPNDRVAIVTFDDHARVDQGFSSDKTEVQNAIDALGVIEPEICDTASGPCREYERDIDGNIIDLDGDGIGDRYLGFSCPVFHMTGNPSTCGTTAIGQGLFVAGNESTFREDALRLVILLSDGAANAPSFVCPHNTWIGSPFCRDLQLSRHCNEAGDNTCTAMGGVYDPDKYDADDYARDMADFVAEDQATLIYTIGLGNIVRTSTPRARVTNPDELCDSNEPIDDCIGAGEQLLRYAANISGGNYYYAPSGNELEAIFLDILNQIDLDNSPPINLEIGWNLVSFNVQPVDAAIEAVLSGVDDSYDLVYAWDAAATGANWKKYDPDAGFGNTLTELDETMGFWIHMTEPGILEVVGTVPDTTEIELSVNGEGWNLVGYPSIANQALPGALSDHGVGDEFSLVYAYHADDTVDPWKLYDREAPFGNDLIELAPGWGYWVRVSAESDWSVKYFTP